MIKSSKFLILIFSIILSVSLNTLSKEAQSAIHQTANFVITSVLTDYCEANQGETINEWKCTETNDVRKGTACKFKSSDNVDLIFNGCTGVSGTYATIFFKACILHDFCYHHEPATSGLTKKECDSKFLNNMLQICNGKSDCNRTARLFHSAVALFGNSSYQCKNIPANYPNNLNQL